MAKCSIFSVSSLKLDNIRLYLLMTDQPETIQYLLAWCPSMSHILSFFLYPYSPQFSLWSKHHSTSTLSVSAILLLVPVTYWLHWAILYTNIINCVYIVDQNWLNLNTQIFFIFQLLLESKDLATENIWFIPMYTLKTFS